MEEIGGLVAPGGVPGEGGPWIRRNLADTQLLSCFIRLVPPGGFPRSSRWATELYRQEVDSGVCQGISSSTYFKCVHWTLISLQGVSTAVGDTALRRYKRTMSGRGGRLENPDSWCHLAKTLCLPPSARPQELPFH